MSNIELRWVEHPSNDTEPKRILQYRTYNMVQNHAINESSDQPQYIGCWSDWKSVPIITSVL